MDPQDVSNKLLFVQSNPSETNSPTKKNDSKHERARSTPNSPRKIVTNLSPQKKEKQPNDSGNSTISSSPRKIHPAKKAIQKDLEEVSTSSQEQIDVVGLETSS